MLKIKQGVHLHGVSSAMIIAAVVVAGIFEKYGYDAYITAAIDGTHSPGSLHYVGEALDFRTSILPVEQVGPLVADIKSALTGDYDVIFEKDHLHVEHQPKQPYGA